MRKGYGPTGVSFGYSLDMFKDVAKADVLSVELVFNGNTAMVAMDMRGATDSELKALYDAIDCSNYRENEDLDKLEQVFTLFAG